MGMADKFLRKGFLCSFDINEARTARKEILTILNTLDLNHSSESEKSSERNSNEKGKPHFSYERLSTMKNMCFILNNTDYSSTEIQKELKERDIRFRFCKKIVPLDVICSQHPSRYLKAYLEDKDIDTSFKICYRSRFSDKECKENIFSTILERYKDKKVDLTNPKYSILVEVV